MIRSYVNTFEGIDMFFTETCPEKKFIKQMLTFSANPLFQELNKTEQGDIVSSIADMYMKFGLLSEARINDLISELHDSDMIREIRKESVTRH